MNFQPIIHLDLSWPGGLPFTAIINVTLVSLFSALYIAVVDLGIIPVVILFVINGLHVGLIWYVLLLKIFFSKKLRRDMSILSVLVLYLTATFFYATWHALLLLFNPVAFIGIPTNASPIHRLLLSLFVATKSNGIFPASNSAFISVGFNTVNHVLLSLLAIPVVVIYFLQRFSIKKSQKEKINSPLW